MTETVLRTTPEKRRFTVDMRALSPFIALIVLVIAGALINPDFLTASNILNVVTRSAFIAIIAVGATFVIAGGGLDLSVGSMAAFVAGEVGQDGMTEDAIVFLATGVHESRAAEIAAGRP